MTLIKTLAAAAAGTVLATSAFAQSASEIRGAAPGGGSMPAQTTNLFLLEDLEDASRTRKLAESDLNAPHAVADWIKTYVVKPHKDLGRAGAACPFVPGPWNVRHSGLLQSRSPTGTCQLSSSS